MKTILICPNQAHGIPVLAEGKPLLTLPLLGETFITYWMSHLASRGATHLRLITSGPAREIEHCATFGARWGLSVEILCELRNLSLNEARKRYRPAYESDWLPEPFEVVAVDHLPDLAGHKLFASYENWFQSMGFWLSRVTTSQRVGLHEIQPGVWAGRRTRIGPDVTFAGPAWLGENVRIGKSAVVGPMAFLEDRVVLEAGCTVVNSWVGPDTFVGAFTELTDSLGWGSLLINWRNGSHIRVPDSFLMASLDEKDAAQDGTGAGEPASTPAPHARPMPASFDGVIPLTQKLQG